MAAHDAVLSFISVSGPSLGVPKSFSPYLVSVANAGNGIGRLVSGFLADYFGASLSPSAIRPPHSPPSHRSRSDERHDTGITHCGRSDDRMATHTRNCCARHDRRGLWCIVQRDGGPHRRADDGARRMR